MIELRKLDSEHIQLMRKWRNQNREYFRDQKLITFKQQEGWFEKYLSNVEYWYFIIYVCEIPIGVIGFSIISKEEAHIESVILGEKRFEKHGYTGEALEKVMSIFPFKVYSLKVLRDNKKAISFYQKHGFSIKNDDGVCFLMSK